MHWLGLILLAGGAFVFLRWVTHRHDSLGRPRPFPTISIVLLVTLGVAFLVPMVLRIRLEGKLAKAASSIVGTPVSVHCQSFGEAFVDVGVELGYVPFGPDGVPEKRTLIKRAQCGDLASYLRSDMVDPSLDQVVAVHTLTHEAVHMSGVTNEAETECSAVQRDAEMARLLGAEAAAARSLASTYWTQIYPRMPDPYRSEGCRPGGQLDLDLPEAPWE